jgi:hypothetical protein
MGAYRFRVKKLWWSKNPAVEAIMDSTNNNIFNRSKVKIKPMLFNSIEEMKAASGPELNLSPAEIEKEKAEWMEF